MLRVLARCRKMLTRGAPASRCPRGAAFILLCATCVASAPMPGCAQYQLRAPSSDPVDPQYIEVTSHAFFWGLVYSPEVQNVRGIDGINDVIVMDNLGYDIISVVTLGIWKPMTIRYRLRAPLDGQPQPFPVPDESSMNTTNSSLNEDRR